MEQTDYIDQCAANQGDDCVSSRKSMRWSFLQGAGYGCACVRTNYYECDGQEKVQQTSECIADRFKFPTKLDGPYNVPDDGHSELSC